jgi:hypothetical protein
MKWPNIKFAQEPAPSNEGLGTIDMGENEPPYYTDDSAEGGDVGSLFDDAGAGDAAGGGGLFDAPPEEGIEEDAEVKEEEKEPYEVEFVRLNYATYSQLIEDASSLIKDHSVREQQGSIETKVDKLKDLLLGIGWTNDTLDTLSLNNPQNLDNLLEKILENEKNFSSEIDILSIFNYVKGGNAMFKKKFDITTDGRITRTSQDTAEDTPEVKPLTAREKLINFKDALSYAIVHAKRLLKQSENRVKQVNGLLYRRDKIIAALEDDEALDVGEGEDLPEDEEVDEFEGLSDTDMEQDLEENGMELGQETGELSGLISQLTEAIDALTQSIGDLSGFRENLPMEEISPEGDISSDDMAGAEGLETQGRGLEAAGMALEAKLETLEGNIKKALKKTVVKKSSKEKGDEKLFEAFMDNLRNKKSDTSTDTKEGTTEDKTSESTVPEKKAMEEENPEIISETPAEGENAQEGEVVASMENPELILAAVEDGKIKEPKDFWAIPDDTVKKWSNISNVVSGLQVIGREDLGNALKARALDAFRTEKKAKYTDTFIKDIGETSKVMDDGSANAMIEQGGDIDKGFKATRSDFNSDSQDYPENYGEQYGTLASPAGQKEDNAKAAEHSLSDEQKLKVRKAFETAFEEQFKNLIKNPLAVSLAKKFITAGFPEEEAIKSAYEVLAEGFQNSVLVAMKRGFDYTELSEAELLRRSKDVAVYKVSLFEGSKEEEKVAETEKSETKFSNIERKPVLKSLSTEANTSMDAEVDRILKKLAS